MRTTIALSAIAAVALSRGSTDCLTADGGIDMMCEFADA